MKKLLIPSLTLIGFLANAQNIGDSPYASFGIGEIKYDNSVEITSMAGISTAYISDFNHSFNFKNPATNKNLELTNIRLEGTNENNFFKSNYNNTNSKKQSTYLSNIAISLPLSKKVKFGMGYQPYSSKRYSILKAETLTNNHVRANNYRGEGSINTLHAGLSYNITPEIGVGVRANYFFGTIKDIDEITYSDVELINGHEMSYKVTHFNFTLGAVYQKDFFGDKLLTIGATSTIGKSGNFEGKYLNSTYYYINKGVKTEESIIEEKTMKADGLFPLNASLGIGYGEKTRWFLGTQVDYKKGENLPFFGKNLSYTDSFRYAAGGWFIPDINNFRNYFSRVVYRYGAFYEKGNLNINNKNINKFGLTLGASFPFKSSSINRMSSIDLGLEIGRRGTLQNDLIRQNYVNLKIGLNFADKWFRKTQYD